MISVIPQVGDALISASVRRRLTDHQTSSIQTPGGKYGPKALNLGLFVPGAFDAFVEPFAGGLNMTMHLIKRGWVHANQCYAGDLCVPLVDYHRVVAVATPCERMVCDLLAMEADQGRGSPSLFVAALNDIASDDPYRRARGFYLHNVMAHNGIRDFSRPSLFSAVRTSEKGLRRPHILRLPVYGSLLAGTTLLCDDYELCVNRALGRSRNPFIFFDPPYPRPSLPPHHGFDRILYGEEFDHGRFVTIAHSVASRARMMITLNDLPENRRRFSDYPMMSCPIYYGTSRRQQRELVITNYEPPSQHHHATRLGWEMVTRTVIAVSLPPPSSRVVRYETTPRQGDLITMIRLANLANGRAQRHKTPKVIAAAIRAAEKVGEKYGELTEAEKVLFRLPTPGDRCVPAYNVEYPRYFPIHFPSVEIPPDAASTPSLEQSRVLVEKQNRLSATLTRLGQ